MDEREMREVREAEEKVGRILSEALREELGETGDIPEVRITRAQLHALERADRRKRRRKRAKYVGAAAAVLLVFVAVIYIVWPSMTTPVDADKDKTQVTEAEENKVFSYDNNGEAELMGVEKDITDWRGVKVYKEKQSTLYVPEYMPKGYEFKKLNATELNGGLNTFEYTFKNDQGKVLSIVLQVMPEGGDSFTFGTEDPDEVIEAGADMVYLVKREKELTAHVKRDRTLIDISGEVSKSEMAKIVKGLK